MTTLAAHFAHSLPRSDRTRVGVELGHEPPIEIEGPRAEGRERRRIPLRWMFGVALTGLSGLALIGSALYLGLDRQSNFAEAPEFAAPPRKEAAQGESVNPGKGDRLVRPIDIVAAKHAFKAPTTIKVGDKEVLKARPFTLLSTTLTTTPTGFADAVPPFDPLKAANASAEKGDAPLESGPAPDDSEVAFFSRDISAADAAAVKGELTLAEAQAQVVEWIKAQAAAGERHPQMPPQMMLMRTSRASVDTLGTLSYATTGNVESNAPFTSIEVRMVPENVSSIAKTPPDPRGDAHEQLVQIRHGETFEDVLRAHGADKDADRRDSSGFRLEARGVAGRGGAEDHPAVRGCGRRWQASADRPHFRLFRRTAQGDDRDRRPRRLSFPSPCAGAPRSPNARTPIRTKAA